MLATLKPKAEVYDASEYRSKTRNIAAIPVTAQKLIQPVSNAFFKNKKPFNFSDFQAYDRGEMPPIGTNINLQGMSFADGAASHVAQTLNSLEDGQHGIFFMSDNLFVFNKIDGRV